MGCASSKAEDLPLVALCRERSKLIRAAADRRYALAAAHASYFRALDRVGDALHRFAADELVAAPASPVLTLPPSEGKPPRSKSGRSDSAASSAPHSSSTVSPFSGSHLDDECHHLHHHSGSDSKEFFETRDGRGGVTEECNSYPHPIPFNSFPNTKNYYMKAAPTTPSTFYLDPYSEQWSGWQRQQFGYGYGYGYGYPSIVPNGTFNYYELPGMNKKDEIPAAAAAAAVSEEYQRPPPPPPPPQRSSWDFFNPFDSYEQMLDGYAKSRYGMGSVVSSPNSSEVREQEGIPDLEEETEQESVKETGKRTILEEKRVMDDDSECFNSSVGSSEAVTAPHLEVNGSAVQPEGLEEKKRSLDGGSLWNSGEVDVRDVMNERLCFDESATSAVIMEDSRRVKDASFPVHRTNDVLEAVKEIREQFKAAACCGEDVSKVLEVGKIQCRPRIKIFKCASVLQMSETAPTAFEKYVTMKSSNLSSTLEQLYIWERKLYKLVKDEEKLRVFYDREYTRLKALDDRGAESNKIDSTRAAINKLITKISMTIKSVDAISRRIHKLRDEELRPQLIELIHGLIRMWKSMLDCHQRQFQAIVEMKSQKFLLRSIGIPTLTAKATAELELELMNWCSCFSNWVRAQKAYIDALNGWLMKWLHQGQEETPDEIALFSPGRIGAPAIFVISNDWHNITDRTSESEVLEAMHSFATNLHRLWESQDEEQQQKLKSEYLSKDFAKRLKALQKQNSENVHLDASDMIIMSASNNSQDINGHMMHLDLMRKRLDEEKAKHLNSMMQIHEVASSSLRAGLIPIFEALESYSSQTLKGYNELRLLDNSS